MLHTATFNFTLAARMKSGGAEQWGFQSESRSTSTHAWWGMGSGGGRSHSGGGRSYSGGQEDHSSGGWAPGTL